MTNTYISAEMSVLLLIDLFLRGGIVTVALATGAWRMTSAPRSPVSWAATTTGMAVALHTVTVSPALFPEQPPISVFLGGMAAAALWWLAMELFEVGSWARRSAFPLIVLLQVICGALHAVFDWTLPCLLASSLILLHILWVAIAGRAEDLVETRRRLRWLILVIGAAEGLLITYLETMVDPSQVPLWVHPAKTAGVLFLLLAFAFWLISNHVVETADPEIKDNQVPKPALSAKEQAVLGRLQSAMSNGMWRQEGLTIGSLATEIDTSEHRLRRVINQGLGYRNFAQFINGYRISAAKVVLSDPERADRSVLEIAHQVGFASLGPFNRAFRAVTGESPTEYRAHSEQVTS